MNTLQQAPTAPAATKVIVNNFDRLQDAVSKKTFKTVVEISDDVLRTNCELAVAAFNRGQTSDHLMDCVNSWRKELKRRLNAVLSETAIND